MKPFDKGELTKKIACVPKFTSKSLAQPFFVSGNMIFEFLISLCLHICDACFYLGYLNTRRDALFIYVQKWDTSDHQFKTGGHLLF
jgi:hypothetical protein